LALIPWLPWRTPAAHSSGTASRPGCGQRGRSISRAPRGRGPRRRPLLLLSLESLDPLSRSRIRDQGRQPLLAGLRLLRTHHPEHGGAPIPRRLVREEPPRGGVRLKAALQRRVEHDLFFLLERVDAGALRIARLPRRLTGGGHP